MGRASAGNPARLAGFVVAGLFLAVAAFLLTAFHTRYWRWRDCFNDLDRCWDPVTEQVYTTAGAMWGVLATPFLALGLLALVWAWRRH